MNGFTIVSFWDRSSDKRFGSNSSFIEFGHYQFNEMIALARIAFPKLFARFDFEIRRLDVVDEKENAKKRSVDEDMEFIARHGE